MASATTQDQGKTRYVLGADGHWWMVVYSSGGDDFGYQVSGPPHHSTRHHAKVGATTQGHSQYHTPPHRPVVEDPWQGNWYARELFQGQGAGTFVAADRLVTRTTEVYAALYTAAFYAPEIIAAMTPVAQFTLRPAVSVFARLYGTYLATAAGGTVAVLGRYPEYLDDAESMGANVFSMSMRTYNFLDWFSTTWTANRAFIDRAVATGQSIYLATPPIGQEGSIFEQELLYLRQLGVSPFAWRMVPR